MSKDIFKRKFFVFLFRVTRTGDQGNLGATIISAGLTEWQGLGIELCLTFVIVLVYLVKFLKNLLNKLVNKVFVLVF